MSCLLALGAWLRLAGSKGGFGHDEHNKGAGAPREQHNVQAMCLPLEGLDCQVRSKVNTCMHDHDAWPVFLLLRLGGRHLETETNLDQTTMSCK